MKVLIVAPQLRPVGVDGYGGVERLCSLFAGELRRVGHEVAVACSRESVLPEGVRHVDTGPASDVESLLSYRGLMHRVNCVLDFSHSHLLPQMYPYRCISVIWHDPKIQKYPEPSYNVVALSRWQAKRFKDVYGQKARVLSPICADPAVYYYDPQVEVSDRFLSIGVMTPDKGNLQAVRLAQEVGAHIDVVGQAHDRPYTQAVVEEVAKCPEGECRAIIDKSFTDRERADLFRQARALLYPVSYPKGYGEAHSMKMVEAMMCGTPCITYDQGAMRELTGVALYKNEGELASTIKEIKEGTLGHHRQWLAKTATEHYSVQNVVAQWIPVMQKVAEGERW
ncbi:MAG: glycosyltransferase [Candidatus Brocadiales bacterium]